MNKIFKYYVVMFIMNATMLFFMLPIKAFLIALIPAIITSALFFLSKNLFIFKNKDSKFQDLYIKIYAKIPNMISCIKLENEIKIYFDNDNLENRIVIFFMYLNFFKSNNHKITFNDKVTFSLSKICELKKKEMKDVNDFKNKIREMIIQNEYLRQYDKSRGFDFL